MALNSIGVRARKGKEKKMLVGLITVSVIIGAIAGGAAMAFGNGILIALLVYSFTASTMLLLLAMRHHSLSEADEQERTTKSRSDCPPIRAHSG